MISAQTPLAFVARENRYTFFRIMLLPGRQAPQKSPVGDQRALLAMDRL
jgi:hypothetical protein